MKHLHVQTKHLFIDIQQYQREQNHTIMEIKQYELHVFLNLEESKMRVIQASVNRHDKNA